MVNTDKALTAHLLRRAGFGATCQEIEHYTAKGYDVTVDELLVIENLPALEEDLL